jgi:hypothetical protein
VSRLLVRTNEEVAQIVADALAHYDHSGDWWSEAFGRDDLDVNVFEDDTHMHVTVYPYKSTLNILITKGWQRLASVEKVVVP